ncbi:MAG: ABC transporter substrate-binding protein [Clostridiaceae bacterium]|nr:ABC transporter substrate-binding protein [Clostridiaceae bacterium]
MSYSQKLALILLGLSAAGLLTACSSQPAPAQGEKDPSRQESVANQEKQAGAYPFTLENYGRQVEISGRPQKVLTLGPNCAELFAALGLQDTVVGRSLVNHSRGPLPEYRQAVEAIPQLNYGSATREAVLSSGADFIYALDWEIGGGVDLEEAAQYGMTVYINSAVTLEQQYQEIRDIGRIFGAEQAAEAFVAQQEARIQAVQDKIGDREPVKVLVYDSGNDGVFTCSGVNFESLLIGLAGGQNLFDDLEEKQWVTVSYEEVLLRQPDVILIHDYDSPSLEEKIAEIQANPTLAQLDCVKNQRFASITLESVLPGDRMAYAVEQMAQDFYPDLWQ